MRPVLLTSLSRQTLLRCWQWKWRWRCASAHHCPGQKHFMCTILSNVSEWRGCFAAQAQAVGESSSNGFRCCMCCFGCKGWLAVAHTKRAFFWQHTSLVQCLKHMHVRSKDQPCTGKAAMHAQDVPQVMWSQKRDWWLLQDMGVGSGAVGAGFPKVARAVSKVVHDQHAEDMVCSTQ